jgi:hypothetical protein
MNRYQPSTPRALLAIAALVMTAFTLSLSVLVPASMDFDALPVTTVAAGANQHTPIRVTAARDATTSSWFQVRSPQAKRKQQS